MYDTYSRIFTRLGLKFRAVFADTGAIGGSASHEFHVLADSGEDALAFSETSDYAANVELAEALSPGERAAPSEALRDIDTPTQKTCEDVAALMGIPLARTAKSIAIMGRDNDGKDQFVLALVRGDHMANEIKLAKLPGLAEYRLATEAEIADHLGSEPGFLGPLNAKKPIRVVADRSVAALADFVVGANRPGFHIAGVNWGRDLPEPEIATSATWSRAMPRRTARACWAWPAASRSATCSRWAASIPRR
jgi:prolyl-tRNA synthetase